MSSSFPEKAATIADVARRAGVAKSTASRLLSGARQGTPEARLAVETARRELGYRPNPNAQRLARGRCDNTIGLFSHFLDLGVGTLTLRRVQQGLGERGYSVPLHVTIPGAQHQDHLALLQNVCSQRYRAIVGAEAWMTQAREQREIAKYLRDGGQVVLYASGEALPIECDQVLFNRRAGYDALVHHLSELGHRKIGVFFAGMRQPGRSPHLKDFQAALDALDLEPRAPWVFAGYGGVEHDLEGQQAAAEFLQMPPSERPTAMLVISDSAALGFITTLERAGLHVPRDLSVVGHDNKPIARLCSPPLTSMSYPIRKISARVVELLCERLDGTYGGPPRIEVIAGELARRESTGPPPA